VCLRERIEITNRQLRPACQRGQLQLCSPRDSRRPGPGKRIESADRDQKLTTAKQQAASKSSGGYLRVSHTG